VAAERPAHPDCVADHGNIMEEGGNLAALEALDREFVESLQPGCRRNRIAALCLIAIRSGKLDVEMLASPEGAPGRAAEEKSSSPFPFGARSVRS
jgi:hypothetical protein